MSSISKFELRFVVTPQKETKIKKQLKNGNHLTASSPSKDISRAKGRKMWRHSTIGGSLINDSNVSL